MSLETATLSYWTPFLEYVADELDVLSVKLKTACDECKKSPRRHAISAKSPREMSTRESGGDGRSPRNRRHAMSAKSPREARDDGKSPRNGRHAKTRRANVTPSIRKEIDPEIDYPVQTNYRSFPARKNASARIYRPHRLEWPIYRNEKRVVPVLYGEVVK